MKGGKSMVFKSDHDVNTLKERWDDKTAFKNFAGGDDYLDNVFISRRYGSIVCLKSKPLSAHNLFGAVYWGIIHCKKDGGSKITGFFGISLTDLIITAAFYLLYGSITRTVLERGDESGAYWMIVIAAAILFFIPFTSPKTKRKYAEVINRVVK